MFYTVAIGPAKAKYLKFTKFIFAACDHSDLGGTDIEPDDNGLFVVHDIVVFSCLRILDYDFLFFYFVFFDITAFGLLSSGLLSFLEGRDLAFKAFGLVG